MKTWKLYSVSVPGFGREIIHALSKQDALREARNCEAFGSMTLTRFRQIATAYMLREPLEDDGYDYIRQQYGLDVRVSRRCWIQDQKSSSYGKSGTILYAGRSTSHVRVALDGSDTPLNFHPLDVSLVPPESRSQAA
ncbi:hypothetical protein IC232_04300 [Microvirga sp. BT688]|uniref:hypothetical protein n=1 Tax=Microvirga sp. TaxID=1873136 RepID=UPI00168805C2|nr:hypothetical protein [Microvirga sp.]MBD2745915.1 hypothetical protein [Microvirga sp.]